MFFVFVFFFLSKNPKRFSIRCKAFSSCLFSAQNLLIVLIVVRQRGHLCDVDLKESRQKGMRQQPTTHLWEEQQTENKVRRKAFSNTSHCQHLVKERGEGAVPYRGYYTTRRPGEAVDTVESFCDDELLTFWTLSPARIGWKLLQVQNHYGSWE